MININMNNQKEIKIKIIIYNCFGEKRQIDRQNNDLTRERKHRWRCKNLLVPFRGM